MEYRLQNGLQVSLNHHLGDSVRDRGNPQRPRSSRSPFGMSTRRTGGGNKAARATSDSRSDRGCCSSPLRTLRSIGHRRPPRPDSPSPAYTPPTLHAWQYKTVLLYPRESSPCGLPTQSSRTTTPLRSSPITGPSTLLRAPPPLCPASVLSPLRMLSAWVSPFASGRQVPTFLTKA